MTIEEILDVMDEALEDTISVPLSKKRVVDIETIHDYIDDIRLNLPAEMRQAKAIVSDRREIVETAKKECDALIKTAEKRALTLIDEQQIVKDAAKRAAEILHSAGQQAKDMKKSTENYCDKILKNLEDQMSKSGAELRTIRTTLHRRGIK